MNLITLLKLNAVCGKGEISETPIFFSAVSGTGKEYVKRTTNSYGTTIDTTSAEGNTLNVTQVYDSQYTPTSYRNGYICIGFNDVVDWVNEGANLVFVADIVMISNPAEVTTLDIYYEKKGTAGVIADGKLTATLNKLVATENKYYLEIRCGGCSFTLSNCKLIKANSDATN